MNCKNCTKHKGDCGHHFIDGDEHIHYDILQKAPVTDMEIARSTPKEGVGFKYR